MADLLKKLPKLKIIPRVYRELPESAGIYVFFSQKTPIYIGKAINLKRRVASYFDIDLGIKTSKMIGEANELSFIQVDSELEALLLEAKLIRSYMPKYNVSAKDDKHPLYIAITKEKYPRVITVRKIDLKQGPSLSNYGPFPSSTNVRSVLKMIRRIFPYSDHKLGKRGCLYSHIGLCSPCPNEISNIKYQKSKLGKEERYRNNIKHIKSILDGKIRTVQSGLVKEMKKASNSQNYELASQIRDQIERIEYITRPQMPTEFYMQNPNLYEDVRKKEMSELKNLLTRSDLVINNLNRIECFDISHLSGTNATASMVTFIAGNPDKSLYRHFRIRQKKGNSDIDSFKEVITRRFLGSPGFDNC
jgi:excinuclease ABC subunit C